MPTIVRKSDQPYRWGVGKVALAEVANKEKMMPRNFITEDGFGITAACRRYLAPLIRGEDYPPYKNGLPSLCQPQESAGCEKAQDRVCAKVAAASPGGGEAVREKQGTNPIASADAPFFGGELHWVYVKVRGIALWRAPKTEDLVRETTG